MMLVYRQAVNRLLQEELAKPYDEYSHGRVDAFVDACRAIEDTERELKERLKVAYEDAGVPLT